MAGYLSKWKHLRKLSVSPFNNEPLVGEYLRGSRIVYYSKPRSEHVCLPGPLNEALITEYFKGVAKAASGCILEVAQRECGTIYWDTPRAKRYVDRTYVLISYCFHQPLSPHPLLTSHNYIMFNLGAECSIIEKKPQNMLYKTR